MTLKEYPAQLSLTTLICTMGALQGAVITLVIEKAKSGIWSMHKETELVATLYSVRNFLKEIIKLAFFFTYNSLRYFFFSNHHKISSKFKNWLANICFMGFVEICGANLWICWLFSYNV